MKLLSAEQFREWEAFSMQQASISTNELIERAATACVDWIKANGYFYRSISVFCGKGNNGADGLSISRLLIQQGLQPQIYLLDNLQKPSPDFQLILDQFIAEAINIHIIKEEADFPIIPESEMVLDALFGIGLNRPLEGLTAKLIVHINQSNARVIAIDVPSGMLVDSSCKNQTVIKAEATLTFQSLKRCFLMAENDHLFGQIFILDINLEFNFLGDINTDFEFVSETKIASLVQPRKPFAHKGNHGHALLIAGSRGKIGAAVLAAKSCLRSGAGLLTINIPDEFSSIIHHAIAEAMVIAREANMQFLNIYKSIGIGPGLGVDAQAEKMLLHIFSHYSNPMVIDADAITVLSKHPDWLKSVPAGSILAPHPKEFDRLFGSCENEYVRTNKALDFSKKYPFVFPRC